MFSGWREKRDRQGDARDRGWGPPHPPPDPLIPPAPKVRPPGSPGLSAIRHNRRSRHSATATLGLIAGAALGAAALVALAVLTTGLPSFGHSHPQRIARAASKASKARPSTPAPAIKKSTTHSTRSSHTPRSSSTTTPPAARDQSASIRSTLTAVNAIIDETGAGRERVIAAIDAVQSCSMPPSDAEAAVGQVVSEREQGLRDLQRLDKVGSTAPADRSVIRSLTAVLNDSVQADQAYMAWMRDIAAGSGTCGTNPMNDTNFAAGQEFSTKADGDKQVFLEAWNPLADQHGLATYQPQDF